LRRRRTRGPAARSQRRANRRLKQRSRGGLGHAVRDGKVPPLVADQALARRECARVHVRGTPVRERGRRNGAEREENRENCGPSSHHTHNTIPRTRAPRAHEPSPAKRFCCAAAVVDPARTDRPFSQSRRPDSNRGPLHYEERADADGWRPFAGLARKYPALGSRSGSQLVRSGRLRLP